MTYLPIAQVSKLEGRGSKPKKAILNSLRSHHGEVIASQLASALGLDVGMVANYLGVLRREGYLLVENRWLKKSYCGRVVKVYRVRCRAARIALNPKRGKENAD